MVVYFQLSLGDDVESNSLLVVLKGPCLSYVFATGTYILSSSRPLESPVRVTQSL